MEEAEDNHCDWQLELTCKVTFKYEHLAGKTKETIVNILGQNNLDSKSGEIKL